MSYIITNTVSMVTQRIRHDNGVVSIVNQLRERYGVSPCIGCEIEFYLIGAPYLDNILGYQITKEKGMAQYEVNIPPMVDIERFIVLVKQIKDTIKEYALNLGGSAIFHPKPFRQDYGNAIHFHISLLKGGHYYTCDIDRIASHMCDFIIPTFLVFAPTKSHYARFDHKFSAPTSVCFGNNNRTVAIRIPCASPKRMEYRLASPETDVYAAIFVILKSLYLSIERNEQNIVNLVHKKIYGNAFDSQYQLQPLPRSIYEAYKAFDVSFFVN